MSHPLVRELAVRLGADYRFLHAPAALESAVARDALLAEPSISESLAECFPHEGRFLVPPSDTRR